MSSIESLEHVWQALGRQERELLETIATATARIKALRLEGNSAAANEIADARAVAQEQLRSILQLVATVQPRYFALVNTRRKRK
jgi:hypothetical protein